MNKLGLAITAVALLALPAALSGAARAQTYVGPGTVCAGDFPYTCPAYGYGAGPGYGYAYGPGWGGGWHRGWRWRGAGWRRGWGGGWRGGGGGPGWNRGGGWHGGSPGGVPGFEDHGAGNFG